MASTVNWALVDHAASEPVRVGDQISADAGGMPVYRVIALAQGRALLADEQHAVTRELPLAGFCWRSLAP